MIHFVGAGSGAADLITLRGKSLLETADVVIYAGSLVNPELLRYTRTECEVYNSAEMTLDEVIDVMEKAENSGGTTVRLHTGDPCLYGAVREQMDRLDALDIAYDVCPGVSSFCGAAAALKAEYTLPDVSQTVILTRMAGRTPVPESESIESLAAHNATMVIFLSAGMLTELSERLKAEKEYLGEYVTAHPLDEYPTFAEMGVTPIDDADGYCKIYGVIDAIDRKQRKSDGKDMAFITLNDGSGEMAVNFFTKQYASFKELLEEGNVIVIAGEAREEETDMIDDEGNPVLVRKFYPDNVEIAKRKSREYVMTVPSYAKFHLFQEENFRKEYEKKDGNILIIHDALTGKIRRTVYRVSEQVKNLQNVN